MWNSAPTMIADTVICLTEAIGRLELKSAPQLWVHEQQWSDTGCGFSGMYGQTITVANTVVVMDTAMTKAAVYHGSRFAYLVTMPTEAFWEALSTRTLPGQGDRHNHLSDKERS